tara:strand:+ start:2243 stop:2446 length:204 start_codon:yes stop_codon:yes gene_type:complete
MKLELEDLKAAGCYKLKRATFIVLQIEEIRMLNFPIYHLYFIKHRDFYGMATTYAPSTLTALLKKWS